MPLLRTMAHSVRRALRTPPLLLSEDVQRLHAENLRQHRALLEALRARSPRAARELMTDHILTTGRLIDGILDRTSGNGHRSRRGAGGDVRYVVVGGGAIGGTVAAGLVRDGHDVLVCDTDPEHVAAINRDGLTIEGPVEEYTVQVPAVAPDELPAELDHVLFAVKAHHTRDAMRTIAPRLAPNGYVVSLQNGMNEPEIVAAVGENRVVGAFVNFGADVVGPGRILRGNRATFRIGELDGADSERVRRLAADIADAEVTTNVSGYLWAKEAYGAMLFATAVSDLSIADALADPAYRPLYLALAREVLDAGHGDAGALRRLRPERSRRLDRPARRVQPRVRQDALRDLPRPRRPAPQDRGGRDAGRPRRPAPAPHRRGHPRDRGRSPGLRAREPRPARRVRAARTAGPAAERRDRRRRCPRPGRSRAVPWHPSCRQGQHGHAGPGDDKRVDGGGAAAGPGRRRGGAGGCAPRAQISSARPTCSSTPRGA